MSIIYLCLCCLLSIIALMIHHKKEGLVTLFQNKTVIANHFIQCFTKILWLIAGINLILFVLNIWYPLPKWIGIIDILSILISSMIFSFKLLRHL